MRIFFRNPVCWSLIVTERPLAIASFESGILKPTGTFQHWRAIAFSNSRRTRELDEVKGWKERGIEWIDEQIETENKSGRVRVK
jgi:hypothetical protein